MYLRIAESEATQNQQVKERFKKEQTRKLRIILKSKLNAKKKISAIGALVIAVPRYSFGMINWRL